MPGEVGNNSMPKVIFRNAVYDYPLLRPVVFSIMDDAGGGEISRGSSVLIKPNLLAPADPSLAVTTHPLIIRAVAEYALFRGAAVQVSDSPAMGSFEKVAETCGLKKALAGMDVLLKEFTVSRTIDTGEPFRKIEIAEDVLKADFVINLPKLKTHTQMRMTLGVKNMYGCIVGMRKPEWHLRAGVDRDRFAQLLLRVCLAARPSVTLLDGILAMEGQGPGKSGTPRQVGVIIGSRDPVAVDRAVCSMISIDPYSLPTTLAAREMGLCDEEIEISGEMPAVADFRLPGITPLIFGPDRFHGLMRRHLIQRPECDDTLCRQCGECRQYCPAKAIAPSEKGITFDYEKCIRCYCCIEVCPHAALRTHEPLLGRTVRRIAGR